MHDVARDRLLPLVGLALECVTREYPNHVSLWLRSAADLDEPRELTPAFYGCLDWHSAVHSHWLLARAARLLPRETVCQQGRVRLGQHLSEANLARELRFLGPRPTFERPYGLAWLLRLHQELATWRDDAEVQRWAFALAPLAGVACERLCGWLVRLTHPVRSGVHSQTAFAMGLALDWARALGQSKAENVLVERARVFHATDRDMALHLEPSGEDFLSPALGAADLMRRVLEPDAFARWLERALPGLGTAPALEPVACPDPADGRLAHLDGLNLSRAWMLHTSARHLPPGDARRPALEASAAAHARAGLAAIRPGEYMGSHWLGSFALYLQSEAGLQPA